MPQPQPFYVPPINPNRGKGAWKAGRILLIIAIATVVGAFLFLVIHSNLPNIVYIYFPGFHLEVAIPTFLALAAVVFVLPTGFIMWIVGRTVAKDTAAQLAFMEQQTARGDAVHRQNLPTERG